MAAGSALIVDGAICAGDTGCGATAGGTISFTWQSPADETQSTWCEDLEFSWDASCGEGIVLNSGIDEAISSIVGLLVILDFGGLRLFTIKLFVAPS